MAKRDVRPVTPVIYEYIYLLWLDLESNWVIAIAIFFLRLYDNSNVLASLTLNSFQCLLDIINALN